jgi:uncharacterized membrane protein HdeD (DUF308 family)
LNEDGQIGAKLSPVGAWAGIGFTVLFVAGFIVFPTPQNANKNPGDWEGWWSDSGHRIGAVIGAYLMVLGLLAFVWFIWSLHRRLRDSGPMVIFGSLFVAVAMVSALVRATIAGAKLFGDDPVPAAEFSRMFDSVGFALLLIPGALAAAAFIVLASHHARRQGLLPGWLTTAGYVVAALQFAAGVFLPFVLFPLWVLVASIVLLRRSRTGTASVPTATSGS